MKTQFHDHNKPFGVLLLGGPADGQRVMAEPGRRFIRVDAITMPTNLMHNAGGPTDTLTREYVINTIIDVKGVHYVAQETLNECPVRMLVAGYRRRVKHESQGSIAENFVLLLGGDADGMRMLIPDGHSTAQAAINKYHIVRITGKDLKVYRVGVLDAMAVDPIELLIAGYQA